MSVAKPLPSALEDERYLFRASAKDFNKIPGSPICYWISPAMRVVFESSDSLGNSCKFRIGMATGRNAVHVRYWHEVSFNRIGFHVSSRKDSVESGKKWFPYAKGGGFRKWAGNEESIVDWEDDGRVLQHTRHPTSDRVWAHNFNLSEIFNPAICWTVVTAGKNSFRLHSSGFLFDAAAGLCQPKAGVSFEYLLGLLNSKVSEAILPLINPTINLHPGYLTSLPALPVDALDHVSTLHGLAKADWDSYEISWGFGTSPLVANSVRGDTLRSTWKSIFSRGKRDALKMLQLEEINNRVFIDAYGLQGEVEADVSLDEVTLTCNPKYRYGDHRTDAELEGLQLADTVREFISYAVGCMFGRYSLDKPGLVLANQGETLADYLHQVPEPTFSPDADNVIPLLDGEWFNDDMTERFRSFLRLTFGEAHYAENLKFIEDALGKDIRRFFLRDFYNDHVKRYKKRPIYWLFSSPKGSFNALIYLHRYRPDTASVVLQYLRDFQEKLAGERKRQEQISISTSASQGEKTRALKSIASLKKTLVELDDYEREVLHPLATQQIAIDLDDGVKVNYGKFGKALKRIPGLTAKDED